MTIDFVNEFEISEKDKSEIAKLLSLCFTDMAYSGRTFFKQLPHYRLLLRTAKGIIGQLAIDYRIMNLNDSLVSVFGVIDLAVHPEHQGLGLGKKLMEEFDRLSALHKNNIDFLFLVTDKPAFYERLGYIKTNPEITWLKINEGKNLGVATEQVTDCFIMVKEISGKKWPGGSLDMLGYWY